MEDPLTELRNQRLPRRKMGQTYGKKKIDKTGAAHRDLFGVDEHDIESQLASLSLDISKTPVQTTKTTSSTTTKTTARTIRGSGSKEKTVQVSSSPIQSKISAEDRAILQPLLSLSEGDVDLFTDLCAKITKALTVEKIGEGSFAEVFKLTSKEQSSSKIRVALAGATIIKVIPLNTPSSDPNTVDRLSSVDSVTREIKVLRTLDRVHGFTRFRGVRIVTGLWPRSFLDAFRTFRRNHRKRAINTAPDDDFDEKQIYALVEMEDAGSEISLIRRPSVFQTYDLFWMSVIILANAEEQVEFEHRDLHNSNICVQPSTKETREKESSEQEETSPVAKDRLDMDHSLLASMSDAEIPAVKLGLSNIKITVIDYTVARCILTPGTADTNQQAEIAYDPMRFLSSQEPDDEAPGADAEANDQLETYRKTKAAVKYAQRTSNHSGDKWSQFVPRTNVVWLGYLLRTLSRRAKGRSNRHYVVKGSSKVARKLQQDMWDTLAEVEDVVRGVDPNEDEDGYEPDVEVNNLGNIKEFSDAELERMPGSAKELLLRAMAEGWLSNEEFEAFKATLERES